MPDDIVTRLRDEYCDGGYAAPNCGDCVQCEAADEIERLRKQRDSWRDMAITLGDYMANVPQRIVNAYNAIWYEKYAKKAARDDMA